MSQKGHQAGKLVCFDPFSGANSSSYKAYSVIEEKLEEERLLCSRVRPLRTEMMAAGQYNELPYAIVGLGRDT